MNPTTPSAPVDDDGASSAGGATPPPGPRTTREEARDLTRLRRSREDKKLAGVAGGLARHLDVDPVILRVAFVVLTFFGGAGLIAYVAGWLFLPTDDGREAVIGLEDRTRSIALVIVGVLAGAALLADLTDASGGLPWQLALVGLVAVLLLSGRDRSGPPAPPGPDPAPGPGPSPGAPAGTEQPTYAPAYSPTSAPPAYGPPTYEQPAYAPPRSPRRRGPVLFWFTLALVTLAEGVLGVVDLAGAPVAAAAYPALALGLVGAMLVVGSFFGRAGGLIALGLLTVPVLAVATVADEVDPQPVRETPLVAASVDERYDLGAGELVLDLTRVEDLESLDGRDLVLDVGVGSVEVVVPEGLSVDAEVVVGGVGHLWLFDEEREGFDLRAEETYDAGADAPQITLRADLGIGEIRVRTEEEQ